ncbi:MAG: hypothetical protein ACLPGW_16940 [Roseiarcus sp.]
MRIRKLVAILATASLAFWTPSIIPVKATTGPFVPPCGFVPAEYHSVDTAFAVELVPCPTTHAPSPAPAVAIIIGSASVILNAIIVWNTQCRELTSQEAMTSAFLPLIGIALDAHASQCPR